MLSTGPFPVPQVGGFKSDQDRLPLLEATMLAI